MIDPVERLRRLADELTASGELAPAWREAFLSVPRHAFIPEIVWRDEGRWLVPLRRADDPETWLDLAYGPEAVVTQVDHGRPVGPDGAGREITSSASQPNVVARMLAALDAEPGMTVCEIGTGTGYNAALLAARLGAENVTTIEVDPHVAAHARRRLMKAGYDVVVITGDGAKGHPPRAPYDRIIATAAVRTVPYSWIAQTQAGGRVLTPWGTAYHNGVLLSLTVSVDGTALGRTVGDVAFMWLRDQRLPQASGDDSECDEDKTAVKHTDIHPYYVAGDDDAALAIGLRVPNCKKIYVPAEDGSGEYTVCFTDRSCRSWAHIKYVPGSEEYEVHQAGPRHLWDEIEAAYQWWLDAGSPKEEQFRLTVTPEGQHVSWESPSVSPDR